MGSNGWLSTQQPDVLKEIWKDNKTAVQNCYCSATMANRVGPDSKRDWERKGKKGVIFNFREGRPP